MKRVFIIHGYTGNPEINWFPWLKTELEKLGFVVAVPAMPHSNEPTLDEWLGHLNSVVGTPDQETYLIGHSLGCPTILRYLERLEDGQKIGGALLVAGFAEPLPHLPELDSFTEGAWNDEKVKAATDKLTAFCSDNDMAVPLFNCEHIRDRFGAELIVLHNKGQFNERDGVKEVPFVLEKLINMINA